MAGTPSIERLRGVELFASLDDADLESLAAEFNHRTYAAGSAIATEGESGLVFFVVDAGEAVVTVGGREVAKLGPGQAFGEIALIDKRPRSATVTAATELEAFTMPIWSFRPFVEARPAVAWKLLEVLADRLAAAQGGDE